MNKLFKNLSITFVLFLCLFAFVACTTGGNDTDEDPDDKPTGHQHIWSSWESVTANENGVWGQVKRTCFSCDEEEIVNDELTSNIPSQLVYRTNHRIELSTVQDGKFRDYTISTSNRRVVAVDSTGRYLEAKNLGEAVITIEWRGFTFEYTIQVVDELTIELNAEMPCLTTQTIVCKNAQGSDLTGAELVSSDPEVVRVNSLSEIEALKEGSATLTLTWNGLTYSVTVNVVTGYYFDYTSLLHKDGTSTLNITSTKDETIEDYEVVSSDSAVIEVVDKHNFKALGEGVATLTVTYNGNVIGELKVVVLSMVVDGNVTMNRGGMQILNVEFTPNTEGEPYTVVSSNEDVITVVEDTKISAVAPGVATVTVTTESGLTDSITITVNEVYYDVTFDLSDEDKALLPEGFIESLTKFAIVDLPISLPEIEKDQYAFLGWSINGKGSKNNLDDLSFEIPEGTKTDVKLTTVWGYSRLELNYPESQIIKPNETMQLELTSYMIAKNIDPTKQVWSSDNETIATVDSSGVVTGKNEGNCVITVYLADNPNITTSIGVTIIKDVASMSEVVNYFLNNAINTTIGKYIKVTGYQFVYSHRLLGSVTNYLFDPLVIDETSFLVPKGTENRPGDVNEKYYVVVHDTASSADTADARAHGRYIVQGGGGTSWHYSVGNDGVYHHIPDNERAYHAGDGSRPYHLNETGIQGTNKYPVVTITEDGYYALDGVKTPVAAPKYNGQILTTDKINDQGIRVVLKDGYYFIGDTYYNDTYHLISNTGGNRNSIGMETMVNQGSDIYLTWHRTAQLVAHLVKENNLTLDDVKPHHYFSGKNCPQTMRDNGLYENFLKMVECEYMMITKFADYKLSFSTNFPEYIASNGRVIKQDATDKSVSFTITFTKGTESESVTLWTVIPGYRR